MQLRSAARSAPSTPLAPRARRGLCAQVLAVARPQQRVGAKQRESQLGPIVAPGLANVPPLRGNLAKNALPSAGTETASEAPAPAAPRQAAASPAVADYTRQPLFLSEDEDDGAEGDCNVYMDRDGHIVEAMCCDYGFRSGDGRMYQNRDGAIPRGGFEMAWKHFNEELEQLRRSFREDQYAQVAILNPPGNALWRGVYELGGLAVKGAAALDRGLEGVGLLPKLQVPQPDPLTTDPSGKVRPDCFELRTKLLQLKLSNDAVWARETEHAKETGGVETPWFVKAVYLSLCVFLDTCFNNRPIARFWFLETVARMPYFSYISCLHLYESLGWWRAAAELRKVHFAEEWNELHHLQIMESLGGDRLWVDRVLGYHSALLYYFVLVAIFFISPPLAYNFSELIETHAIFTYGEFCDANEEILKSMPPPLVALQYYRGGDLYMFDEFQTSRRNEPRNPPCDNLYDVFMNIRDDEGEHVRTMKACQDASVMEELAERKERPRRL